MSWWQYLLLVNIYLVLFYVFYVLLLRKETFFQLNRIYLVTAALLSFFIPMIQADWVQNLFITQQVKYTIYSSPVMIYSLKPVVASHISIGQVLAFLYGAGMLFLSVRLIWQLIKLKRVINQPQATAAYSFFGTVRLDEANANNTIIEAHEQVHAKQWHSADVMLVELVMIINWFNPVVYMYRFAIKHIHEYIADRQAVQAGTNKAEYALLLLSQTFESPAHQLVNPFFNHSLLKQRIIMLQKNKSQRISLIKYGLSAPLFILMLILSSATINNSKPVTVINKSAHQLFTTPATSALLGDVLREDKSLEKKQDSRIIHENKIDTVRKKGDVYTAVEKVPEFPGGLEKFGLFLGKGIKYPKVDRDNGTQGRVIVTFVVEKDGALSGLKVTRGVSKTIDAEAIRVLKASPKWTPGIEGGKKVRVQYSVPISFTLAPDDNKPKTDETGQVFTSVEHVPEFPGGLEAFGQFLGSNVKYPKADREKGVQGRVIATFIVEADGSLSNIVVTRGISKAIDEEAIRVLDLSPKWKPGIQNGRPVRVQYSVPISFTLANDDKSGKPEPRKMGMVGARNEKFSISMGTGDVDTVKSTTNDVKKIMFGIDRRLSPQPLYVLDGKVIDKSDMEYIMPNSIESLAVLKGATAMTLYGSKGANGVILITSKGKRIKILEPKNN
ncbi:outer membrane transport energization protein TonB [Mucilaginibacter lappiensis]|uniref:TonB family protein n=1 Tax=Mucilaginibacter lappiensis TaxID=354630 RepID=A0ABR6PEL1_9SPHI|nr:M56 family metallopeptidase [Mucilaginibacter lappiensis]MBB6108168.1 TonB family protein [Mucilaginibacter lappiensis]SIQ49321.1 outer membrane transport energization protein TonB [Mucilaginibacter lappiensis]